MAFQKSDSSSFKTSIRSRVFVWTSLCVIFALVVLEANAQTFQYSRGWTNGKRSGGPIGDIDNGLEELSIPLSSIRIRPHSRLTLESPVFRRPIAVRNPIVGYDVEGASNNEEAQK